MRVAFLVVVVLAPVSLADEEILAPVTCVAVSPDGKWVIDGSQHGVRIRPWKDFTVRQQLPVAFQQIHDVSLSPDGRTLAIAGGNPAEYAVAQMYSWPDLRLLWSQEFSVDVVYSIAFAPDGDQLAVSGHDHSIYMMDSKTGTVVIQLDGHSKPVAGVAFLADGTNLLSCSVDQTIRVWNTDDNRLLRSLTNHIRGVNHVVPSNAPNQTLAMVASVSDDRTVRFWQPTIGRMVRFKRMAGPVTAVAWSHKGGSVFVGTKDQQLHRVDVQSLDSRRLAMPDDGWIYDIAVHPEGTGLVFGTSNGAIRKLVFGE